MRANSIDILINDDFNFEKNFYFISGNEITLIEKIKDTIISRIKKNNQFSVNRIKSIESHNNSVGLFEKKTLYVVGDLSGINSDKLDSVVGSGDVFVFPLQNTPKIKNYKNIFFNRKDSLVVDCYELTRENKAKIFNSYVLKNKIKIDESLFWAVVDKLDNRYGFMVNELDKISMLDDKRIDKNVLEKIIVKEGSGVEKMFFKILNKNQDLINYYNDKIINQSDVNDFYYSFKQFCLLIINSENEHDFSKTIPRYLFKEKGYLLEVYKKYNPKKKRALLELLEETEKNLRKNSRISQIIGLRFYLGFKKITIS